MSTPTILDFYRANVGHPNSIPYREFIMWKNNTSPIFTIVPANSTETLMIREISWWFDNSAKFDGNRRVHLTVTQSSPPPSGTIDLMFDNPNDIFGAMTIPTLHRVGNTTAGAMNLDPPIKLDSTSESIIIQYENSSGSPDTGGIKSGYMRIGVIGWALLTVDY
ncbi:MAG: hypothetical protein DRP01_04435 [Archaeoglobales archaeon]|nr:MAG: hypothetical protein DRP01_04435 [Archaeoglobales archaeon]